MSATAQLETVAPSTYGRDASTARFSVARYERMIEEGILTRDHPVELLENYVVLKMPRSARHDGTVQLLVKRLGRRLPEGWDIRSQSAIRLSDSQPEPDLAIVRGDEAAYVTRHPYPEDIGLVVEVADSALLRDQRDKSRIYARAGIVAYWIVNLADRRIEVHTAPSGATEAAEYMASQSYESGESVALSLASAESMSIPVDELLPD